MKQERYATGTPWESVAVLPELQDQGIDSALVQKGMEACRQQGHRIVVVLGHAHFYPGSGFRRSWPRTWSRRFRAATPSWR